jgi:hypothetical protein
MMAASAGPMKPSDAAAASAVPRCDLLLTLIHDQRSYLVNIKSTAKGAQLLAFAKQEFHLGDNIVLHSEGIRAQIDLARPLRDQIPFFDIVRVKTI